MKKPMWLIALVGGIAIAGILIIGFNDSWWAAFGVVLLLWAHNLEHHWDK